jgi:hypothetical protein
MKTIKLLAFIAVAFMGNVLSSCNGTSNTAEKSGIAASDPNMVEVIYFHGVRRCPTCVSVGEVSKAVVETEFADNRAVVYKDINIDEPENAAIAEAYEVSGSALFVTSGDKKENLTGFAFQNARSRPEVLKEKIRETVNAYINK